MIVITGLSGVGKTTTLSKMGIPFLNLDDYIKEVFYIRGHQVFHLVDSRFSLNSHDKIDTKKLGQIVFNDTRALNDLNDILFPFIKELLKTTKFKIVEMATYLNYEKEFSAFFDKVVLLTRKDVISNIKYIENFQPIKQNKVKLDLEISLDNQHDLEKLKFLLFK